MKNCLKLKDFKENSRCGKNIGKSVDTIKKGTEGKGEILQFVFFLLCHKVNNVLALLQEY